MNRIIILSGPSNTGKTSSIKRSMNSLGAYIGTNRPNDVLLVAYLHINGNGRNIGFASGGDTINTIQENMEFFRNFTLDYIICACRSRGASLPMLNLEAKRLNIEPDIITTEKSPEPSAYILQIAASIERLVS